MARRKFGGRVYYVIIIVLIGLPLYQLYTYWDHSKEKQDATKMLYQASLFQIDLVNSLLHEAPNVKDTDALNSLKQAAYSASYIHDRLAMAVGSDKMSSLSSIQQLMQFILRLQIGGARTMKDSERSGFLELGKIFEQMDSSYQSLFASSGEFVSSENGKLEKSDQQFTNYVQKQLLK